MNAVSCFLVGIMRWVSERRLIASGIDSVAGLKSLALGLAGARFAFTVAVSDERQFRKAAETPEAFIYVRVDGFVADARYLAVRSVESASLELL